MVDPEVSSLMIEIDWLTYGSGINVLEAASLARFLAQKIFLNQLNMDLFKCIDI